MNKIVLHIVGYTAVASGFFFGGALTRDYLVTREAQVERGRYAKFLNHPAPLVTSRTLEKEPWDLRDHKGKVVMLEMWATWCGPCIASLPETKRIHGRFGKRSDFALVGVSLDKDIETVKRFCERQGITWSQLIEPGKEFESSIARALEAKAIPFICVIDKQGVVRVYRHASSDLERLIQRLLDEPNSERSASPEREAGRRLNKPVE